MSYKAYKSYFYVLSTCSTTLFYVYHFDLRELSTYFFVAELRSMKVEHESKLAKLAVREEQLSKLEYDRSILEMEMKELKRNMQVQQ